MRLKHLKLSGFKSFADRTAVVFHPGITGIVGPNGCGKSNISDAFRWVLGEQSAKSMRGGKMHDVIFAGTSRRKALGVAEVTLTFTDVGEALPVEYEEVAITRRLHRSGESEYLLNNHPVRLKDIRSLFLDSGVGKNAFFEQGKVDRVINQSPNERREIFEEAAGIQRFLLRKREAMRKLEQTKSNTTRLRDIHGEVEKRIDILKRQAEQARSYKDNKVKLETLDKAVLVGKWDLSQSAFEQGKAVLTQIDGDLSACNKEQGETENQLKELRQHLGTLEGELKQRQEAVYKVRSAKQMKAQEQENRSDRIAEATTKLKSVDDELKDLRTKNKARHQEKREHEKLLATLEKQRERAEKALEAHREKVSTMDDALSDLRSKRHCAQEDRLKLLQAEHAIVSELKEKSVRLEGNHERLQALEVQKEIVVTTLKDTQQCVKERQATVASAVTVVEKQKAALNAIEDDVEVMGTKLHAKEAEQESNHRQLTEMVAREKALLRLREEMEGISAGSRRLLKEAANTESALYGKVQALHEVIGIGDNDNANTGKILAAALKPYADTVVVKTRADFAAAITFAKEKKLRDISLLCLQDLPKGNRASATLEPLLDSLIGDEVGKHFLGDIYASKTIDAAREITKKYPHSQTWTEEGLFVDHRGVVFFATHGEQSVFLREAEIKSLAKGIAQLKKKIERFEKELDALSEKRAARQQERIVLDKEIRSGEMKLVESNFLLQQATKSLEEAKQESEAITKEMKERRDNSLELSASLKTLTKQQAATKKDVERLQDQSGRLDSDLGKREAVLQERQQALKELTDAAQAAVHAERQCVHALEVLSVKEQESSSREERLHSDLEATRRLQEDLRNLKKQSTEEIGSVSEALQEAEALSKDLEKQLVAAKKEKDTLERKLGNIREAAKKLEKEQIKITGQQNQCRSKADDIARSLDERYGLAIEQARSLDLFLEGDIEQSEKVVKNLRRAIEEAGDVNMTSIEEFDKQKVRYEFLDKQIDDLDASQEELLEIIDKLNKESSTRFEKTFEQIRVNFRKNFEILFVGGEADLHFIESNDILEAGIDIMAKPPGKQMRSIHLLSGGEKCLTAIALLFAIFEVKPSSFCILDEIDAPLDDTNVERFLNVVKQFIDRCQFVIITHNKRTMSVANQLFGITMQEKGVSKLLTMRFNHQDEEDDDTNHSPHDVALVGAEG